MKLLLTSAGIKNKSIKNALFELLGKDPKEASVVFIPTAANVESEHKDWFVGQITEFLSLGDWKQFDFVDIAALEERFWRPKLEEADIVYVSGGNEFF